MFLEYDPTQAEPLPNETTCPACHLTYHAPLGACPHHDDTETAR